MRRHTTKQPSGPAVAATPTPATSARTKKSSSMARPPRLLSGGIMAIGRVRIGVSVAMHAVVMHMPVRMIM